MCPACRRSTEGAGAGARARRTALRREGVGEGGGHADGGVTERYHEATKLVEGDVAGEPDGDPALEAAAGDVSRRAELPRASPRATSVGRGDPRAAIRRRVPDASRSSARASPSYSRWRAGTHGCSARPGSSSTSPCTGSWTSSPGSTATRRAPIDWPPCGAETSASAWWSVLAPGDGGERAGRPHHGGADRARGGARRRAKLPRSPARSGGRRPTRLPRRRGARARRAGTWPHSWTTSSTRCSGSTARSRP